MEVKKNYFPTSKAPDIAKKKVMQYVYWTKKNLSKRFYFYRIYAPAFLLLFIAWWWITYYNKELKPIDRIQRITMSDENKPLVAESDAMWNFVSDKGAGIENQNNVDGQNIENPTAIPTTNNIDQAASITKSLSPDNSLVAAKINNPGVDSVNGAIDWTSLINTTNVATPVNPQATLSQQISDIENLMKDISAITSQEEVLF